MASTEAIQKDLVIELGLRDPSDKATVKRLIQEAVLDILGQRNGRFLELKRTQIITYVADTLNYELNDNFGSPYLLSEIEATTQIPNKKWALPNLFEVMERKDLGKSLGRIAYVDNYFNGTSYTDKFVLIIVGGSAAGTVFRFDYFRKPEENDAPLVQNETIIKKYVRSHFPEQNRMAERDAVMYERLKASYRDRGLAFVRDWVVKPSKKIQRHNQFMDNIGDGRGQGTWDR